MARGRPKATVLNAKQEHFVREYLTGISGKEAARKAGFNENAGTKLLKNPLITSAIEAGQQKLREETQYTLQVAMREAQEVIDYAKVHGQGMAFFKAVEHRAKLSGLLIERVEVKPVVNLSAALAESSPPRNIELEAFMLQTLLDYHRKRKLIVLPPPQAEQENPFNDD